MKNLSCFFKIKSFFACLTPKNLWMQKRKSHTFWCALSVVNGVLLCLLVWLLEKFNDGKIYNVIHFSHFIWLNLFFVFLFLRLNRLKIIIEFYFSVNFIRHTWSDVAAVVVVVNQIIMLNNFLLSSLFLSWFVLRSNFVFRSFCLRVVLSSLSNVIHTVINAIFYFNRWFTRSRPIEGHLMHDLFAQFKSLAIWTVSDFKCVWCLHAICTLHEILRSWIVIFCWRSIYSIWFVWLVNRCHPKNI